MHIIHIIGDGAILSTLLFDYLSQQSHHYRPFHQVVDTEGILMINRNELRAIAFNNKATALDMQGLKKQAAHKYKSAADLGHIVGQVNYAKFCYEGVIGPKDPAERDVEVRKYLELAIKQNFLNNWLGLEEEQFEAVLATAKIRCAEFYARGLGGGVDLDTAKNCYKQGIAVLETSFYLDVELELEVTAAKTNLQNLLTLPPASLQALFAKIPTATAKEVAPEKTDSSLSKAGSACAPATATAPAAEQQPGSKKDKRKEKQKLARKLEAKQKAQKLKTPPKPNSKPKVESTPSGDPKVMSSPTSPRFFSKAVASPPPVAKKSWADEIDEPLTDADFKLAVASIPRFE